jgi:hypothetical protein
MSRQLMLLLLELRYEVLEGRNLLDLLVEERRWPLLVREKGLLPRKNFAFFGGYSGAMCLDDRVPASEKVGLKRRSDG